MPIVHVKISKANFLQLFASKLFFRPRLKACNNSENAWSGCKVEMTRKNALRFLNGYRESQALQQSWKWTHGGKISLCNLLQMESHSVGHWRTGTLSRILASWTMEEKLLLTPKPQQKYNAPNSSSCVCLYFTRTLKWCYIPSVIFLILEDLYFSHVTVPV